MTSKFHSLKKSNCFVSAAFGTPDPTVNTIAALCHQLLLPHDSEAYVDNRMADEYEKCGKEQQGETVSIRRKQDTRNWADCPCSWLSEGKGGAV